jgi:integrase/recombinase XerD
MKAIPEQAVGIDSELVRFEAHLVERGLGRDYILNHRPHARQFLEYLKQRGIGLLSVQPAQVASYFRVALRIYKKHKPNRVKSLGHWRVMSKRSVEALLRFERGEWPPGACPPILERFRAELVSCGYNQASIPSHLSAARQFLRYLNKQGSSIEEALPAHLKGFLQMKLEAYQKRFGCHPKHSRQWHSMYSGPIGRLLRLAQPEWPPVEPPANECERFQREVCDGYGRWLTAVRGLSQETLRKNGAAARVFLRWLGERADRESLGRLSVADIDAYLAWRMVKLRRATRYGVADCMRSFLRYLNFARLIPRDLSFAVSGPVLYQFEEIPRAFSEEQVEKLLEVTRRDRRPAGLRDYAILMLLSTYGLRAGEVVRLRLEDIDWRGERLRVRQSKTGVESWLPLMAPVGEALLEYLQKGRPKTEWREVFLRVHAPIVPFRRGGSVDSSVLNARLKQAGIKTNGRHGSHAFRFARAARLLDATVPLKIIGDLLGHQSASSTAVYLRLPTEALRGISLELPVDGNK